MSGNYQGAPLHVGYPNQDAPYNLPGPSPYPPQVASNSSFSKDGAETQSNTTVTTCGSQTTYHFAPRPYLAQDGLVQGQQRSCDLTGQYQSQNESPRLQNDNTSAPHKSLQTPKRTPAELNTPQPPKGHLEAQLAQSQAKGNATNTQKATRTPRKARTTSATPSPASSANAGSSPSTLNSSSSSAQHPLVASFCCNVCVQSMPFADLPKFTKERLEEHGRSLHRLEEHELETLFPTEGFSCQVCQNAMPNAKMPEMSMVELEKHGRQLHRLRDDEIDDYIATSLNVLGVTNTKKEVAKYKSPALLAPKAVRGKTASAIPTPSASPVSSNASSPGNGSQTPKVADKKAITTSSKTPAKRKRKDKSGISTSGYECHVCIRAGTPASPMNMAGLLKHGGEHHGYGEDALQNFFIAATSKVFSILHRTVNTSKLQNILAQNDNATIVSEARAAASPNTKAKTKATKSTLAKKRQASKKATPASPHSSCNAAAAAAAATSAIQPLNSYATQQGLGLSFGQDGSSLSTPGPFQGAQIQNQLDPNMFNNGPFTQFNRQYSGVPNYCARVGPNGIQHEEVFSDPYAAPPNHQQGPDLPTLITNGPEPFSALDALQFEPYDLPTQWDEQNGFSAETQQTDDTSDTSNADAQLGFDLQAVGNQDSTLSMQGNQEINNHDANDQIDADFEAYFLGLLEAEIALHDGVSQEAPVLQKQESPFPDPSSLPASGGVMPTQTVQLEFDESLNAIQSAESRIEAPTENHTDWSELFGEGDEDFNVEFE